MANDKGDIVVVGGGPAGIAAAVSAAESGATVLLVDDNPGLGGQIWRGEERNASVREARRWTERLQRSTVQVLRGFRIFDHPRPGVLLAEGPDSMREVGYSRLILCTGARERFLPFPGWTLPNVIGAGGLQALVKSGMSIRGKTVVVAGTGPLLLPVASYLKHHGAHLRLICDQVSRGAMVRFGKGLARWPGKALQAVGLFRSLLGVPYHLGCWPIEAKGDGRLRTVVLQQGAKSLEIECDYLACGFHLVPNIELAILLGCATRNGAVEVDEFQRTSVAGVYCAGEPTGIGGVDLAILEGQITGFAASGQENKSRKLFGARARQRRFASALQNAFSLRPELKEIARNETLLCRCEDVPLGRMAPCRNWREAKLYTRCGMGPCQGRVCGAAAEFLFGWSLDSVRPPVFAARAASLIADKQMNPESEFLKERKR